MPTHMKSRIGAVALAMAACPMGGCGILAPMTDSPGIDAVRGDQSIIQPDANQGIMYGQDPHFDSDSFINGFSGSLGR